MTGKGKYNYYMSASSTVCKLRTVTIIIFVGLTLLLTTLACSSRTVPSERVPRKDKKDKSRLADEIKDLNFPTDLAFADDGRLFFTEKTGALRLIKDGRLQPDPIATFNVPQIVGYNEIGLLGLALSPEFERDHLIYVYHTYSEEGRLFNRVVRFDYRSLETKKTIFDGILGSRIHVGGKLSFGPDNFLYIATGEANQPGLSRKTNSPNGKILRLTRNGKIPKNNPFGQSPVFALGLRNIFGMTFDSKGRLFVTENGPENDDEINMITGGSDYGWPIETGAGSGRFQKPLFTFKDSIAPTGIVFYDSAHLKSLEGKLVFGDYNEGKLWAIDPDVANARPEAVGSLNLGVTALAISPNGSLYAATESSIVKIDEDIIGK